VLLSLLLVAQASAATRTWDGGCGVDTKWSCAANWSENTAPGATDTAVFTSTATGNAVADEGFGGTVASIRIRPGYTGTVSLARSLTVAGPFSQLAGAFTAAGQTLTVKTMTLGGGSFTASSGTTHVSGTLKVTGEPTFNANGGTVDFNGASGTLTCDEVAFSKVTLTHTTGTKTVGASCELPLGESPSAGNGGGLTLYGTLSGSGTLTTFKKLTLGATGELSGFSGLKASALIASGSYDFGEYEPFTVGSDFTMTPGASFVAPTGTASFGKSFTVGSGATFDANEGTIRFVGKTPFVLACNAQALDLVVFESVAQKSIGSDCTLPLGANPSLGSGPTVLNGTLSGSGTLTQTGLLEVGSANPGLDSFTDVVDKGSLALTPKAKLTAPEGTLTVTGHFTVAEGASFDANEGTVDFEALYRTSRSLSCGGVTFASVVLGNKGREIVGADCELPLGAEPTIGQGGAIELDGALLGSGTLTAESEQLTLGSAGKLSGFSGLSASGAVVVGGAYDFGEYAPFSVGDDFGITASGEVVAPEGTAKFSGDFANAGSFEANEGSVELLGTKQAISGSTTFNDLSKVAKAAATLTFSAGSTQTIGGSLTLSGANAEELLSLVSSKPGEAWKLAGSGSRSAKWLSVKDSSNSGTEVAAVESKDGGGNTGWSF
jgi:trimeric autotransporter adhesin